VYTKNGLSLQHAQIIESNPTTLFIFNLNCSPFLVFFILGILKMNLLVTFYTLLLVSKYSLKKITFKRFFLRRLFNIKYFLTNALYSMLCFVYPYGKYDTLHYFQINYFFVFYFSFIFFVSFLLKYISLLFIVIANILSNLNENHFQYFENIYQYIILIKKQNQQLFIFYDKSFLIFPFIAYFLYYIFVTIQYKKHQKHYLNSL